MRLIMKDGVLTVEEKHGESVEIAIVDGELEVFGNVAIEEEEIEEEKEEVIEFPDEPDMPTDSKANYRYKPYPVIKGLEEGDKVRLRLDLDFEIDNIISIGLDRYDEMLAYLGGRDLIVEDIGIEEEYNEFSHMNEDCIEIEDWFLSTRWVTEVYRE